MSDWGNRDPDLNKSLLCVIQGESDLVCAAIGEGSTLEIVANWISPFEDSSLGSMFQKVGGAVQKVTDMTSLTTLASTQVWGGNEPYLFDLLLKFYALSDPYSEVEGAMLALERMIAPEVNEMAPGGRVPMPVRIILGNRWVPKQCYIKSLSETLDKERSADGYLIRADVNVQVGTITMVNRSDIR